MRYDIAMPKHLQFWLPAVNWYRRAESDPWPDDVVEVARRVLDSPVSAAAMPRHWICAGVATVAVIADEVRSVAPQMPIQGQARLLAATVEVAARLAMLELGMWGVPDATLAADVTARVLLRAHGQGLRQEQVAQWMHNVWQVSQGDAGHLGRGQIMLRRRLLEAQLTQPMLEVAPGASALTGWADLWADLGQVWFVRSLRASATECVWDEAARHAMQKLMRNYAARSHEDVPLEDVVTVSVSDTVESAGLPWQGHLESDRAVVQPLVQGIDADTAVEPGTERMVDHFARRVRATTHVRVRAAGSHFVVRIRWDAVATSIGPGAALRWLLFGATPWSRGYGWRDVLRLWIQMPQIRWPMVAGMIWTLLGPLGPGRGGRGWLVSRFCERPDTWEPPARVELRARTGVAWTAHSPG